MKPAFNILRWFGVVPVGLLVGWVVLNAALLLLTFASGDEPTVAVAALATCVAVVAGVLIGAETAPPLPALRKTAAVLLVGVALLFWIYTAPGDETTEDLRCGWGLLIALAGAFAVRLAWKGRYPVRAVLGTLTRLAAPPNQAPRLTRYACTPATIAVLLFAAAAFRVGHVSHQWSTESGRPPFGMPLMENERFIPQHYE